MVYDCIPFFNEVDILKLRLHILNDIVDRFVIEEATVTFSGEPKELCFEKHKEEFAEFLPKIEYIVVDDSPVNTTTHLRDKYQKNALVKGLVNATDEDVIILSDVDEIPNPDTLKKIIENFDPDKIYHFAQRMFYCYMNMEEMTGKLLSITGEFPEVTRKMWLGTKVFSKKNIPDDGIIQLRESSVTSPYAVRVEDGGWHFGYMGGEKQSDVARRIGEKVIAAAHQEYNTEDILAEAKDRLALGQDMFGREASFKQVPIDDSYPKYLLEHQKEYDYLILPSLTKWGRIRTKVWMVVKRYCRKIRRRVRRIMKRTS